MPSIQSNRLAGKEAREKGVLVPAKSVNAVNPVPPLPTYPASPNPNLRTTLPASYVQQPDQQRQWQTGAVRQQRIPPMSATGNAIVGAQAASQTIVTVTSGGGGPLLETDNVKNNKQDTLNLIAGNNVELASDAHGGVTITSSGGDGLVHGDTIWEYDSAYTILRDDFSFGGSGGGSLGDLNWKISGINSPAAVNYNGAFPYFGQLEIYAGSTAANSNAFITTSAALTGASLVRSAWDTGMPLLDYPGWKMTWVFCVRRQDPHNAGTLGAFSAARLSLYVGLGNGDGSAAASPMTMDPRPNVFYGVRFDTDTTSPSIADSTFWLEACSNAIDTSGTTRYNNQGTNGGAFDTGVSLVEGAFHRLEISYLSAGQMLVTLDGVGTTFTLTQRIASLANNAINVGNGNSSMPTAVSGGFTNTNGYIGVAPGSLLTFAGGSLPAAYAGTFPCIQDDSGSATIIATPSGGGGGGVTGAYTMTAYPALYPIASIAVDSTGASAGVFTRSLVVDYFSFVWNKGLASGAPAPDSTLPRYW